MTFKQMNIANEASHVCFAIVFHRVLGYIHVLILSLQVFFSFIILEPNHLCERFFVKEAPPRRASLKKRELPCVIPRS